MSDTITREQFAANIASIARAGASYTKNIGAALLGALYFSIAENDATPANELVGALRKSTKQKAVIDLLEENGNLAWTKIGKKPGFEYFDAQHVWMPEDVKELRKICANWEDYKAVKIEEDLDCQKAVDALIKRLDKAAEKKRLINDNGLRAKLAALVAEHNSAIIDAILGV